MAMVHLPASQLLRRTPTTISSRSSGVRGQLPQRLRPLACPRVPFRRLCPGRVRMWRRHRSLRRARLRTQRRLSPSWKSDEARRSAEHWRARDEGVEGGKGLTAETVLLHQQLVAGARHNEVGARAQPH